MSNLLVHALAEMFPPLDGEEFDALVDDIRTHGQREPIVLLDGKIIDGRNRYRACKAARIEPRVRDMRSHEKRDPIGFVVSANVKRRHLSASQLAMLGARIEPLYAEQAKANLGVSRGRGQKGSAPGRKVIHAAEQAAKAVGAKTRSVERAKSVITKGVAELAAAVNAGRLDVKTAAALTSRPAHEQTDLVRRINEGAKPSDAIREAKRDGVRAKLEDVSAREAKAVAGVFDVVVIDPPWPMEKIERDERPNQVAFDYPTMSEAELAALTIPCAADAHVWLWTTQKFLPMATDLLVAWGLKYICAFVWHKPGGFQPIGLPQYNCEFALYARKGAPTFLDTKALSTCFQAPRGRHSEKPEAFYEVVRRVTAGRRLDMFNRREIDGFEGWGKEASDVA